MLWLTPAALGLGTLLLVHLAAARLVRLDIVSQEPFAGGASFGSAGPYVRMEAVAHGELGPKDPANAGIALLDGAPRNARGNVEYDTDVFILRPADRAPSASAWRNVGCLFLYSPDAQASDACMYFGNQP